jgi:hypothetical protein
MTPANLAYNVFADELRYALTDGAREEASDEAGLEIEKVVAERWRGLSKTEREARVERAREEQRTLRANGGGGGGDDGYPAPRSRVKKRFGERWFEGVVDEVAPGDRFPITVRFDDGDVESVTLEQFHASTTPATAARTATATAAASSRAYLRGLGNEHASESLPGALPEGRNNPARCPYGLYAEQISGTKGRTCGRGCTGRSRP